MYNTLITVSRFISKGSTL